jgi:cell division transport system permease protein
MPYALREALAAFRRTPLLIALSVVAIAFSLFVIGLFALTAHNIRLAIAEIEERVEVVGYLHDDATDAQRQLAVREMETLPEVMRVRYVSRTEALATAMRELEEFRDVFAELETNPLPASVEIRLHPGQRNTRSVERVATHLGAYPFMEDVRYGREWVERIMFIRQVAAGAATMIGVAFALVGAIIIATAIRIAVFARRDEIDIMRLVGATDGFIRRPFLLEGTFAGLLGGLVAVLLTWGAYRFVDRFLLEIRWLPAEWLMVAVLAGTAFGFLSSAVAVRRHLRMI